MKDLIELRMLSAIRELLAKRVNELLLDLEFNIPLIESGDYSSAYTIAPAIALSTCESTEKERLILLDAYTLTITLDLQNVPESDLYCYAYSAAIYKALVEDPTLGGIAEKVTVTNKKYTPPKNPICGEGWGITLTLRITVEAPNAC